MKKSNSKPKVYFWVEVLVFFSCLYVTHDIIHDFIEMLPQIENAAVAAGLAAIIATATTAIAVLLAKFYKANTERYKCKSKKLVALENGRQVESEG